MSDYKDTIHEWVRQEMGRLKIEPASEEFYEGIRRRIHEIQGKQRRPVDRLSRLGAACWQSLPVYALLLILVFLYNAFRPVDVQPDVFGMTEAYVVDQDAPVSDNALFYHITHASYSVPAEK